MNVRGIVHGNYKKFIGRYLNKNYSFIRYSKNFMGDISKNSVKEYQLNLHNIYNTLLIYLKIGTNFPGNPIVIRKIWCNL